MDLLTLCKGIQLPNEALQVIAPYESMDEENYSEYRQRFVNDRFAFFDSVKAEPGYRQLLLFLFLRMAVDAYGEYRARGIDEEIYFDTFSDIRIWCMTCHRVFGEYGIEEFHWLQEHVQLRLFRLGRLQFQPYPVDREIVVDGRKIFRNQLALNVHIPEGEPLDPQAAAESFAKAAVFFRGIPPVAICHSWLLDPALSEILPPESNIIRFQRMFRIYDRDPESREAEYRIFGRVLADPAGYPEQTSLQRNAKAYLSAGKRLGSGYGIRRIEV